MSALWQPAIEQRRMQLADVDAVMAVEVQCYSFPWTRGNFVDSLVAGYEAQVLVREGELIAYFVAMPGVQEMHLLNITVAPAWQGGGLARRMLDTLRALCRERSLPDLWLEVRASNARARDLYARSGFEQVGVRRNYYPAAHGREDAVVMRAKIDGAIDVD